MRRTAYVGWFRDRSSVNYKVANLWAVYTATWGGPFFGPRRDMTINAALVQLKTLKQRHTELVSLRNENKDSSRHYYAGATEPVVKTPVYDIKKVDFKIVALTKEMKTLELAIKNTNAVTEVGGYTPDESVFDGIE